MHLVSVRSSLLEYGPFNEQRLLVYSGIIARFDPQVITMGLPVWRYPPFKQVKQERDIGRYGI